MSRTSKTLLRLGVPGLAAATLVAGIPAFLGTASAATIGAISITPLDGNDTAAAGSCQVYEIQAAPLTPGTSTVGEKLNVVLTNLAGSSTADAAFCTLPTFVDLNTTRTPAAGTTVSTQGATGNTTANSVDQNSFVLTQGRVGTETTGRVFVGVTRNESFTTTSAVNTVRVEAYGDTNNNNTFDVAAGEVQAAPRTTSFTAGGVAGTNDNQNAATVVEVLSGSEVQATRTVQVTNDPTDTAVQNEQRAFRVQVGNAAGDLLNGVTVNVTVSNPNGQTTRVFGTTNNTGVATGTIVFPNVDIAAQSVVTFFVNQAKNGQASVTTDPDASEPFEQQRVSVAQAPAARTIVLTARPETGTTQNTPAYQENPAINPAASSSTDLFGTSTTADGNRVYRVVIDNGAGASGTTANTPVGLSVTGGSGDETATVIGNANTSAPFANTGNTVDNTLTPNNTTDSILEFVVNDPTPEVSKPLTVTALVRGQGTTASSVFTFASAVENARNIDLSPKTATSNVGAATPFTAKVIDVDGNPVVGVPVLFEEVGAGAFRNGESRIVVVTDRNGNAVAETIAAIGEQGTQTITVSINANSETVRPANQPFAARAGNRTDTATNTVTGVQATATPTAAPSATATASASPRPSGSASANPSASVSVSPSSTGQGRLGISVSPDVIVPGRASTVRVTGAPGAVVELQGYSRPSTTYTVVRRGTIDSTGVITFSVTPGTNTRLFAAVTGVAQTESPSVVINVRTALSLTVVRNSRRNYTFQGRILPRRAGQLITLYRVTESGSRILTSQIQTDSTGTYRINRVFTGSGTFGFLTRTGQTLTNASGESNTSDDNITAGTGTTRPTAIF